MNAAGTSRHVNFIFTDEKFGTKLKGFGKAEWFVEFKFRSGYSTHDGAVLAYPVCPGVETRS